MHSIDEKYMMRCLDLAQLGAGKVSPNPMVGSVIVHANTIIGEGWHQSYGGPHAEVNAIKSVDDKSLLKDATIYVNLEPCSIFGNTPPCADLIVKHKIPRVVIATLDDHPGVNGNGVRRMQDNGIDVVQGVCADEALELNKYFICFHQKNRPFILLKWAQSKDGLFSPKGGQKWLSNAATKRLTHKWRRDVDAILIGRKTAAIDNPQLTDRFWQGQSPLRVILDPGNTLSRDLQLFKDGHPNLIINSEQSGQDGQTEYIRTDGNRFQPEKIVNILYSKKILSVMIEGGADTLQSFIEAGLWDECVVYQSEHDLHEGISAPGTGLQSSETQTLFNNQIEVYTHS